MSWEEMSRDETPCPCGNGKIASIFRMDDWNRIETIKEILCDYCRRKAEQREKEYERIRAEKAGYRAKALSLAKARYLPEWLDRFSSLSKKKVWEIMTKSEYGYPSLSTFYAHVKDQGSVSGYLEWRFETDIEKLFPVEIKDQEIEELLEKSK